jgi:hypothetical protein
VLIDLLEDRLQQGEAAERSKLAPVVSALIERTIGALAESPSFKGQVREELQPIVASVIRFLKTRQDAEPGGKTGRAAYLFRADAQEQDLESDLIDWFEATGLTGLNVQSRHIGGGRIDLVFTFGSFRFVIELKRDGTDTSPEGLRTYLGQTSTYQVTDVPIGMLIVLDLTGSPPSHILDNVWMERVPPAHPGGTERFVVVVRVPGNRKVPSAL